MFTQNCAKLRKNFATRQIKKFQKHESTKKLFQWSFLSPPYSKDSNMLSSISSSCSCLSFCRLTSIFTHILIFLTWRPPAADAWPPAAPSHPRCPSPAPWSGSGQEQTNIILVDRPTKHSLALTYASWPTFPLSGKWDDFVDWRKCVHSQLSLFWF